MESLADAGLLHSLIDLTTTGIAGLLVGGVQSAGPERLDLATRTSLPDVDSIGALDRVNFWARDTVPERFGARRLHVHNADVTLMRSTPSGSARSGGWIGDKANRCDGPVRFPIPDRGVSAPDVVGGPFWAPAANEAPVSALLRRIDATDMRRVTVLSCHIDDPVSACAAVAASHDVIVLCHGSPISMPEDASPVLAHCNRCHPFYGASSAERLPAEAAVRDQIAAVKALTFAEGVSDA